MYPVNMLHAFQLHRQLPIPCPPQSRRDTRGRIRIALTHKLYLCMQEYYTSGFLSLQAAIDAYVLDIPSSLETSLCTGTGNVSLPGSSAAIQRQSYWTQWGAVFPTAEYIHNEFYDGVSLSFHPLCVSNWFDSEDSRASQHPTLVFSSHS